MLRQYIIYIGVCVLAALMAAGVPPFPALKHAVVSQFRALAPADSESDGTLPDGTAVRLSSVVEGWVDSVDIKPDRVVIRGWAVDKSALLPAQRVMVYANGVKIADVTPDEQRQDVAGRFSAQSALVSGFDIYLDPARLPGGRSTVVAVLAQTRSGLVGELRYNMQFPYPHTVR